MNCHYTAGSPDRRHNYAAVNNRQPKARLPIKSWQSQETSKKLPKSEAFLMSFSPINKIHSTLTDFFKLISPGAG